MNDEIDEWDVMYKKLQGMSTKNLEIIWDALRDYDPNDFYAPGISMDDWAMAVNNTLTLRKQNSHKVSW